MRAIRADPDMLAFKKNVRMAPPGAHRSSQSSTELAVTDPEEPVRSRDEIAAAIRDLTPAAALRLRKTARRYAFGAPFAEDALLHEAFVRALVGLRNCPVTVDVVRFLAEAIRSIADSERQKLERRREIPLPDHGAPTPQIPEPADPSPNPEEELLGEEEATQGRAELIALFGDDVVAQTLVEGIMDGVRGEDLRALTDLDQKGYESKRRLIRRRIEKRRGGKP